MWHVQLPRPLCKDPGTSEKKIKNLTEKQVPDTSRHLTGLCQYMWEGRVSFTCGDPVPAPGHQVRPLGSISTAGGAAGGTW